VLFLLLMMMLNQLRHERQDNLAISRPGVRKGETQDKACIAQVAECRKAFSLYVYSKDVKLLRVDFGDIDAMK
jgi:hypothetical protein